VPVKPVEIEEFSSAATDVYEAIVIASKRARQIHQDIKIELNQRIETLNQLTNAPDLATQEVIARKVKYRYKVTEQPEVKPEEPEPEA
jgi:DNA-directed RNA polymerase subunit K/omega